MLYLHVWWEACRQCTEVSAAGDTVTRKLSGVQCPIQSQNKLFLMELITILKHLVNLAKYAVSLRPPAVSAADRVAG